MTCPTLPAPPSIPIAHRVGHRLGRSLVFLLPLTLVLGVVQARPASAAPPPDPPGADWSTTESEHFRYTVAPNDASNAETFAALFGPTLEQAYDEISLFVGFQLPDKIEIRGYTDAAAVDLARQVAEPTPLPGINAIADPESNLVSVNVTSFQILSPREAETALRHAVAQILVGAASGFNLPSGFAHGIALYAERPPTPRLARYAAVLADANAKNGLLAWFDINRPQAVSEYGELLAAEAYSVTAFLIDRYTIRTLQKFLQTMQTETDWRLAMRSPTAYNRDPSEIETQWTDNVPRWVQGEWRNNLVAAFDLEPARELLNEARYADAKKTLESSQLLYADLGDQQRLAEVQELLRQCDTGLQAEALMTQAQQALERHSYDRAQALLAQAREQYSQLPGEHQPTALLDTYDQLAQQGLAATAALDEAQRLGRRWGDYPEARKAALSAGTTFAQLGDEEMQARAKTLLDDLDARQRRLVLMLGALAAITAAWLALWLWARGPTELDWS